MMTEELIFASFDTVSRSGTAEGWAMCRNNPKPCHIQVKLENAIVAEDIADRYRPDLLRAGVGHGHCAFYARIRNLAPGRYPLQLFDGRTGKAIGDDRRTLCEVPAFDPCPAKTVEDLLGGRGRWQNADLERFPECLQLDANCLALGPERFVDRVFYFVLGRWADPAGARNYVDLIRRGQMTPNDVFQAVLRSDERKASLRPLPGPMDPDFPFEYDPSRVVLPRPRAPQDPKIRRLEDALAI